jgi:hypothetical protein
VVVEHLAVDLWVQFSIKQWCHWRCLDYNKLIEGVEQDSKENHIDVEGEGDKKR